MTSTMERRTTTTTPASRRRGTPVFSILAGISALAVLLQGLWAGLFFQHGGQGAAANGWMDVHARCGEVALLFAILATAWAFWKLRPRKDLWLGGAALTVLLVLEAWIGGQIRDGGVEALIPVHIPIAMALMGLAVWLPLRARHGR
jgi:hypothetical protein